MSTTKEKEDPVSPDTDSESDSESDVDLKDFERAQAQLNELFQSGASEEEVRTKERQLRASVYEKVKLRAEEIMREAQDDPARQDDVQWAKGLLVYAERFASGNLSQYTFPQ